MLICGSAVKELEVTLINTTETSPADSLHDDLFRNTGKEKAENMGEES